MIILETKEELVAFCNNVKKILYKHRISYRCLGSELGVCANTVGNWLYGDHLTLINKDRITNALKSLLGDIKLDI